MKYPITPEFLAELPDDAVSLYEELERKILQKICEQLNLKGEPNATSLELIRLLQRRGLPLADIEEYIKKTLKLSQTELDNIFQIGIDRNQEYYDDVLSKQQLIGDTARYASIMQEVDAIAQQTHDTFTNLTRSMGFALRGNDGKVQVLPIQKTYQRILDDAEIEVWSGASSYDEAIKNATRRLAESGLQWVDYDSGHHNRVDVAVRRAVMTGITQMSAVYSDNLADELGTPYIEVTAHRGARDTEGQTPWASHKAWQGKVYSRRAGDIYPSVYEICGLGEVDGLCGINCRHHYYPFIEGISERTYTDEELANIDPPPFEFEGKKYTAYEATQKQRQIESTMRSIKRRMVASKAAGIEDDYTDYSVRYRRLNDEYEKFSKAAGLPTQKQRIADYSPRINKNRLYKSQESNIINLGEQALIKNIDSPISRNSAKGKPSAITHFNVELSARQRDLLEKLPEYGSQVSVEKSTVSMSDLSALTAKTGVEYAMFTKGNQRLVIRGKENEVHVTEEIARALNELGYRWSGHTHPGTDIRCLVASQGDMAILECFDQQGSSIYNSVGEHIEFWKEEG